MLFKMRTLRLNEERIPAPLSERPVNTEHNISATLSTGPRTKFIEGVSGFVGSK